VGDAVGVAVGDADGAEVGCDVTDGSHVALHVLKISANWQNLILNLSHLV